jgi:hypothetical protein
MEMNLTDKEIAVLLGATLMHWGVPFHFTRKRVLNETEQAVLDTVSDRLIRVQSIAGSHQPPTSLTVDFSADERRLLVEVLAACLAECGDNLTDMRLHLKADSRDEVNDLLQRLRSASERMADNSN